VETRWNQDAPYNNLCPLDGISRSMTGCVATAMAQIMKYHEHPTTRTEPIPTYTTTDKKIKVPDTAHPIANVTNYNWTQMLNSYISSTSTQKTAVATLMYHCGASVEMNYTADESGANSRKVVTALKTYFDYDAGTTYLGRNYHSYEEWVNLLKTELKANRPVYYDGYGKLGDDVFGHAFVCDGYDTADFFHFNWGWGGSSDGYFELSALNPGTLGIGGGSGGYNHDQGIIIGIQPNRGIVAPPPSPQLGISAVSTSKPSLANLATTFTVSVSKLMNIGTTTPETTTYLGVLLCNQDNTVIEYKTQSNISLLPGYYYANYAIYSNYSLPNTLSPGTYKLYPAFSTPLNANTPIIIPCENGDSYISVVVAANNTVTLTPTSVIMPILSLVSLEPVGNLYQGKTGRFTAKITNSGTADYNSKLSLKIDGIEFATEPAVIPVGTTKTVGFSGIVPTEISTGDQLLTVWYDPDNNQSSTRLLQLGTESFVTVNADPGNYNLSFVSASFPNGNSNVPQDAPNLEVKVKNVSGLFEGEIIVFYFPESGGESIGYFGLTNVMIEAGKTQTLHFNNPLNSLYVGTWYLFGVYYWNESNWTPLGSTSYFRVVAPLPPPTPSSDATLQNILIKNASTQEILTSFTPETTSYTVQADENVEKISIIGEPNQARAKFTNLENQSLSVGENDFEMLVTAEDKTTTTTYSIKVIRSDGIPPTITPSSIVVRGNVIIGEKAIMTCAAPLLVKASDGVESAGYIYNKGTLNTNEVVIFAY
jgi:hypothetical protein